MHSCSHPIGNSAPMPQTHKTQIHRLILLDRVLQQNSVRHPDGAEIGQLRTSVRALLNTPTLFGVPGLVYEELWSSDKAFWRDLNFIKENYPDLLVLISNKRWKYRTRGGTLFPRFGTLSTDLEVAELILALDYFQDHPVAKAVNVQGAIATISNWFGHIVEIDGGDRHSFFKHQFASEDAEVLSSENTKVLHECMRAQLIAVVEYRSARSGESRVLEFHPWEFKQSEGRWYVAGFISADLNGNYPMKDRSDFPGLVLKLSEVNSVRPLHESEILKAQTAALHESRHSYMPKGRYPALLDFRHRIGVGGWDASVAMLKGRSRIELLFRLHQTAMPYFKSSSLYDFTREYSEFSDNKWVGLKINVVQDHNKRKGRDLSVINRELIHLLRSFGPRLEVIQPKELRECLHGEALEMVRLYDRIE